MDLFVMNTNLETLAIVDAYEEFIWTDRYYGYGDFELYTAMKPELLEFIKQDYYIMKRDSDRVMIIEKILITADTENGNHITVSGRSLESILDRRVIWGQRTLSGNLQNAIKTLLNENVISPSNTKRKINSFVFRASTDPLITEKTIEAEYTGDNLYEVIQKLCEENEIGFKITFENRQFIFQLYAGADRSYDQTDNPYVVFSPKFDNIVSSNYIESKSSLKNVALVGGEGEGAERTYTAVGSYTGLDRREMFVDARDLSREVTVTTEPVAEVNEISETESSGITTYSDIWSDPDYSMSLGPGFDRNEDDSEDGSVEVLPDSTETITLTEEEYIALLRQRGKEHLAENVSVRSFEGQMETTVMYRYGEDFFDGDIVQIANEYGHEARVRVIELVTSEGPNGYSVYPTFSTVI